jgi:hypothetical protein
MLAVVFDPQERKKEYVFHERALDVVCVRAALQKKIYYLVHYTGPLKTAAEIQDEVNKETMSYPIGTDDWPLLVAHLA